MIASHDRALSRSASLRFGDGTNVLFQYPPKVLGDGRKGTWDEPEVRATEPVAIFAASSPRNIVLQITYIYDGMQWGCDTIRQQVNNIRGYFQRIKDQNTRNRNLIVYLKLWCIGGLNELSFRMRSCDVKYSETMIMEGDSSSAWPLKTDITLDLCVWTKDGNQSLEGLKDTVPPDWY